MPCLNAQMANVGDILCTNGAYVSPADYDASGLEAMGVVFYVDATGQHGWAVALEDAGNYIWSNTSLNVPVPEFLYVRAAIYDLDGFFNTQEVLNFAETQTDKTFPAFEALDFENGWYLPAIGQLNYLYGNLVEVNAALAICGGTPFDMISYWCIWSSTEYSTYGTVSNYNSSAWLLESTGKLSYSVKDTKYYTVRGVRNF